MIDQRVQFCDDTRRFSGERVISLALDAFDEPALHVKRRDHQFFQAGITSKTGERVKHGCHFLGQLGFAGEQAEIGINARRPRMIIPRSEMDIMTESVRIASDDEQHFAMRFQADHAIDHVGAGFFEPPRPLDVRCFIKSRAKFNDCRHLFACIRGIDQRLNDG